MRVAGLSKIFLVFSHDVILCAQGRQSIDLAEMAGVSSGPVRLASSRSNFKIHQPTVQTSINCPLYTLSHIHHSYTKVKYRNRLGRGLRFLEYKYDITQRSYVMT
jgi:hypothetical protein